MSLRGSYKLVSTFFSAKLLDVVPGVRDSLFLYLVESDQKDRKYKSAVEQVYSVLAGCYKGLLAKWVNNR